MVERIIDSHFFRANVRDSPNGTIIGSAPQGTPFEVIGDPNARWVKGTLWLNGVLKTAFIGQSVLRPPVSEIREDMMRECIREYYRFKEGTGQEDDDPFSDYVKAYWQGIGQPFDGDDTHVPWSAAFVSYVIRKAGGYTGFKYSLRHSDYVHQAIRRRIDGEEGPYIGLRLDEHRPELGDIVCMARGTSNITYDFAANNSQFASHCDIIVRIKDGKVKTIGGNVSNSVARRTYNLDDNGFLKPEKRLYAVMKNMR